MVVPSGHLLTPTSEPIPDTEGLESLQKQVLFETPDLRPLQIHRIGPAFWSGIHRVGEQKIGVAILAATPYLFLLSIQPAN